MYGVCFSSKSHGSRLSLIVVQQHVFSKLGFTITYKTGGAEASSVRELSDSICSERRACGTCDAISVYMRLDDAT